MGIDIHWGCGGQIRQKVIKDSSVVASSSPSPGVMSATGADSPITPPGKPNGGTGYPRYYRQDVAQASRAKGRRKPKEFVARVDYP